MSQSLVAEDEDVRQSCFTKSAEEPVSFTYMRNEADCVLSTSPLLFSCFSQ
jgi:hypothetical protein